MARTESTAVGRPLNGLTVLVVEDDPDAAELVRQITASAGARVLVATDGRDGLRLFRAHAVDVVLLDLRMPSMDGYEVRAQLGHLDPGGVRPPVIAVTAYGTDADYLRTWSADFDAHVTKPVDYDLLLAVILRTLAARPRLRRARRVPPGRRGPSGRAT